jgi:hypothetical protein
MLSEKARHCADLLLAAHHLNDNWQEAHTDADAELLREDAARGLTHALLYLAGRAPLAEQFALTTLATEIDPDA